MRCRLALVSVLPALRLRGRLRLLESRGQSRGTEDGGRRACGGGAVSIEVELHGCFGLFRRDLTRAHRFALLREKLVTGVELSSHERGWWLNWSILLFRGALGVGP